MLILEDQDVTSMSLGFHLAINQDNPIRKTPLKHVSSWPHDGIMPVSAFFCQLDNSRQ